MLPPEHLQPVALPTPGLDAVRQRVDLMNRRFHALAADLDRINETIADMVGTHHRPSVGHPIQTTKK